MYAIFGILGIIACRASRLAWVTPAAVAALIFCVFEASAQSGFGAFQANPFSDPLRPERELGELLTWLNVNDASRTPMRERPSLVVGQRQRVFIPPRPRRDGFVPRLTFGVDGRRNVFFESDNGEHDAALFVAPGLNFSATGSRGYIFADYSFESALYARNDELNDAFDAQSGLLFGGIELSRRTSLQIFNFYQDSLDATLLPISGVSPVGERSRSNNLGLSGSYDFGERTKAEARYRNTIFAFENPGTEEVMQQDGEAEVARQLTPQGEAVVIGRFRHFDFDSVSDEATYGGFVGYSHEFSETLIAAGRLGGAHTGADNGRDFVVGGADLRASVKNAAFSFSYDRDLTSTGGIGAILLSDTFGGEATVRVGPGLQVGASFDYQFFETIDAAETEIDVVDVNGHVSYAVTDNVWLRLRYNFTNQDISGQESVNDQRLILSITGTL